jgi:hypothetical protein
MSTYVSATAPRTSAPIRSRRACRVAVAIAAQRPQLLTEDEMTVFHADDYVHFLQSVAPENVANYTTAVSRCARRPAPHRAWISRPRGARRQLRR